MIVSNILPSNYANAVAPFSPLGSSSVGEENVEAKNSTLKPVEGLAGSARQEFQRGRDNGLPESSQADSNTDAVQASTGAGNQPADPAVEQESRESSTVDQDQLERDLAQIEQLSARDREVHAHERAHASVGGAYAGAPVFQYERGPDGVSYAVAGEVPISTSKVNGDPQATIEKAQQIRRAALAPADPSPQDRQVAAYATQLELEARQELRNAEQKDRQAEQASPDAKASDEESSLQPSAVNKETAGGVANNDPNASNSEDKPRINSFDLNRKLVDIGVTISSLPPSGSLLDQLA